jgi:tRNA pseudouridine13 synthase
LPAAHRERLKELSIELPRRGATFADPDVDRIARDVLKEEGLALEDLKIRGLASMYFGRGSRRAIVVPQNLVMTDPEPDERNAKKLKVTLKYDLPRGSYATLLVKRVFH